MVKFNIDPGGKKKRKTVWQKDKMLITSILSFLYARRRRDVLCYHQWGAGGVPLSLSGAYLEDYASCDYETSWVDRSHQGGGQCTGTITLACLIFELLPFIFILEFCSEHISKTILAMVMKFCGWIDLIKRECSALEP